MSVANWQSEGAGAALEAIRVAGGATLAFEAHDGETRLQRLAEADGWRVRFPRARAVPEAVLVNTGGGIAGGDQVRIDVTLGTDAAATLTSATAERIYRCLGTPTRLALAFKLGPGADLAALPQETILYNGAHLARTIDVAMAESARLTLADVLVLGRRAMPEVISSGTLIDRWRILRGGQLIHAEAVRLEGDVEARLQRRAIAAGHPVIATLLHVAADAADRLEAVRAALLPSTGVLAAASAWNGKLLVRALGHRNDQVREAIAAAARVVTRHPMPRVWST